MALTSTNASVIEMMSPTSRTTMSSPFLSSAAWAAIPASAVGVGDRCRTGVKRRLLGTSSAASVEAAGADGAHDRGRHQPVDRAAAPAGARAGRSRRCRGAGWPRARTRQPEPGGSECASPARSTTTTVARSRVSSSRRQVPMLATASAPSTRNSSRPGAVSASSVSAVTEGASRSISIAEASTPSTPSTAASTRARRSAADATTLPRFCHGSPATTSSTRSRASCARDSVATTTWPTCTGSNVPPKTPSRSIGRAESTGARCLHLGETFASSSPVPSIP